MAKQEKGSWIVRMERTVITDVVVNDCTEEEARDNPFNYSSEETEIDLIDYTVKTVKSNS